MPPSSDESSSSSSFGLSGLSSLSPPGGFSLPPPPPVSSSSNSSSSSSKNSSSSSSSSNINLNYPDISLRVNRPIYNNHDLYLYGYGRQFGEKLTHSAGVGFAAGLVFGGLLGLTKGIRKGGATNKLRLNSILNACSMHAPPMASQLATLSIFYCCFNNIFILYRGDSPLHASAAGALAGCLYKSTSNYKLMGVYSLASSMAFTAIDQYMRRYL